jgi:hypothetical protein
MNNDTREELERLEAALLAEETEKLEQAENLEDFLDGLLDEPTDSLAQTGSVVYNNFANGYGQDEADDYEDEEEPRKSESLTGLMFTAAGLLVGIGAMIIYWVVRFL